MIVLTHMSIRLQVLVPEELDSRLRKAAKRRGVSKGEWVRQAISRTLDESSAEGDALRRLASLDGPTADIDEMIGEIESGRGELP